MPSSPQKKENLNALPHWPVSERPRERLLDQGVEALSDAELLAVFLRSGLPGQNAHALSLKLLKDFGGLRGLAASSPNTLLEVLGLGPAKVATLVAAFEIGKRLLGEKIERQPYVRSAETLFNLLRSSLSHAREEVLMGVLLNAKNEIIKTLTFAEGDLTQVKISIPQILRKIVSEGYPAVIFVHNHPSGDPKPSPEDIKFTKDLFKACQTLEITMHDHLIIGAKDYFSFSQKGKLN